MVTAPCTTLNERGLPKVPMAMHREPFALHSWLNVYIQINKGVVMGAMKAIYTDLQELQEHAAMDEEETFMRFASDTGWISPSEQEARRARAAEALLGLPEDQRSTAIQILRVVGVEMPLTVLTAISLR